MLLRNYDKIEVNESKVVKIYNKFAKVGGAIISLNHFLKLSVKYTQHDSSVETYPPAESYQPYS